ncbi:hypothetical protein SARC_00827 [Sphaeroforma arctica JP610]|uniref:Uncharacterized protein n=1 Tax=Sphaeroforma arctica JP610 TaxID=667725 RepID=A0A0L0GFP1_9EUKA|nr:hypothetical protein SARC_00827 [Sphaeroforma arctica JP610]KNC87083.1 hypothetical protein SARC_00827 [Sphaeroforma arctica JP610]|eukprot:XP_014160985.1 hypothetical protein SARC_00827 [Sphaeroforma arctica JP610]
MRQKILELEELDLIVYQTKHIRTPYRAGLANGVLNQARAEYRYEGLLSKFFAADNKRKHDLLLAKVAGKTVVEQEA